MTMAETNSEKTGSRVRKELEDITECSVCLATFVDPRVLPCVHTFCRACLVQTDRQPGEQHGSGMVHRCPICRNSFPVPENGFDGLPKNFYMERLAEITRTLEDPSVQTKCSVCSEDGNDPIAATTFCLDCRMNLCDLCRLHHRKSKLYAEHRLVDGARGQRSAEALQGSEAATTCLEHDEHLRLFCFTCEELICPMCYIVNHRNHEWNRVDAAARNFKDQIEAQIETMAACVEETNAAKRLLQREREKAAEHSKRLEETVLRVGVNLKELIDRHVEQVLRRLNEEKRRRAKHHQTADDDIERHLVCLESYRSYCTSILKLGRDDEICRMSKELLQRSSELKKQNEEEMKKKRREQKTSEDDDVHSTGLEDICRSPNLIINFEGIACSC